MCFSFLSMGSSTSKTIRQWYRTYRNDVIHDDVFGDLKDPAYIEDNFLEFQHICVQCDNLLQTWHNPYVEGIYCLNMELWRNAGFHQIFCGGQHGHWEDRLSLPSHTVHGHMITHWCLLQLYMIDMLRSEAGPCSLNWSLISVIVKVSSCFGSPAFWTLFIDQCLHDWLSSWMKVV